MFAGAIFDGSVREGLVLAVFSFVAEDGECFLHVAWHEEVHLVLDIIPPEMDADVSITGPVGCDFVVLTKGLVEMLGMFPANIFNTKIVHCQNELDWT